MLKLRNMMTSGIAIGITGLLGCGLKRYLYKDRYSNKYGNVSEYVDAVMKSTSIDDYKKRIMREES